MKHRAAAPLYRERYRRGKDPCWLTVTTRASQTRGVSPARAKGIEEARLLRVDTAARIWKRLSGAWRSRLMKNERLLAAASFASLPRRFHGIFTPIRDTVARGGPIGEPASSHSSLLGRGTELEELERERIMECFRDAISCANAACLARFVAYFYLPLR